jgi:hypothetical protein
MIIPLRGAAQAMAVSYSLEKLTAAHDDLNCTLEEAWGGLLTVLTERWPDWPVEVWGRILPYEEDAQPKCFLQFLVSFAGEQADNRDVAAMTGFLLRGLVRCLGDEPLVNRCPVGPDCKPLWVIDDNVVLRLLVPEDTLDKAVFMLGHYAGQPAFFAASIEAWPLGRQEVPIALAEADLAWAFDGWESLSS